jgi:hypothetical protein
MSQILATLAHLERATEALASATRAALRLAREESSRHQAARGEEDEWTRLPAADRRCPVSGWSRSTLLRRIQAGRVRRRTVGGTVFYSAADVRHLIAGSGRDL